MQHDLADIIRRVARVLPDVRWVDPASIHLTLAFLGKLSDGQLIAAQKVTREAALQSHRFSSNVDFRKPLAFRHGEEKVFLKALDA